MTDLTGKSLSELLTLKENAERILGGADRKRHPAAEAMLAATAAELATRKLPARARIGSIPGLDEAQDLILRETAQAEARYDLSPRRAAEAGTPQAHALYAQRGKLKVGGLQRSRILRLHRYFSYRLLDDIASLGVFCRQEGDPLEWEGGGSRVGQSHPHGLGIYGPVIADHPEPAVSAFRAALEAFAPRSGA